MPVAPGGIAGPDGSIAVRNWLDAHKPAVSARLHLLLAAIMWTGVGVLLLLFGTRWVLAGQAPLAWIVLACAVVVGLLKAVLVLDRVARRTIARIQTRGDGRCIGGFLSLRTWTIVVLMAGAGRLLRGGLIPRPLVGFIYVAVGTALLLAACRLWTTWHSHAPVD
jgi:hypothetical protein